MTSWSMDGIDFIFPAGFVLEPGNRVVIASNANPAIFAAQYPGVVPLGYFGGSLNNSGERISLLDGRGNIVCSVEYDDASPWPATADNGGSALELINAAGDLQSPANWRASLALGGTPGTAGTAPAASQVVISEFLAKSQLTTGGDFVELHNRGSTAADVSGWSLSISQSATTFLPAGTSIPAGGYLALRATGAAPLLTAGTELAADRGNIDLINAAGAVIDGVRYGPQPRDYSFSRLSGVWLLGDPTPGTVNVPADDSEPMTLRLNEWLSNPRPGEDDWLEIYCYDDDAPVVLAGCTIEVNGMRFTISVPAAVDDEGWAVFLCNPSGTRGDTIQLSLPAFGGTIRLLGPDGLLIDSVTYGPQAENVSGGRVPDGAATLSNALTPSPGLSNDPGLTASGIHLSEVLVLNQTGTNAPWAHRPPWIELANNPASSAQSMDGWKLRTIGTSPAAWTFPAGVSVANAGYLRVWCDPGYPASTSPGSHLNTALSLDPDQTWGLELLAPSGHTYQSLAWGRQIPDQSFGRSGAAFTLLTTPTPGAVNSAAATLDNAASVKLNEWYGGQSLTPGNFLEVYHPGTNPVDLGGLWLGDSPAETGLRRWQIPALSFLAPQSHALYTSSGPAGQPTVLGFGIARGGEYLRLSANDAPGTVIDEQNFPGFPSLVSQGRLSDGTATLTTMNPTPGFTNAAPGGQLITEHPQSVVAASGSAAGFSIVAPGATAWQWKFNGTNLPGANAASYNVAPSASPATAGAYTCTVTGPAGAALSNVAVLSVLYNFSTFAQFHGISNNPGADSDGDGISNGLEFLTGTSPVVPSGPAPALPVYRSGPGSVVVGYDLPLDPDAAYSALLGDLSPDLTLWQTRVPDSTSTIPGGTRLLWNVPANPPRYFVKLRLEP